MKKSFYNKILNMGGAGMEKSCPFGNGKCTSECALFISGDELNELMAARLSSIGVLDKKNGSCSLKLLALSGGRFIFENTTTAKRL